MTLTVVVGSSGSGKTTFLEDVSKIHDGVYVRQYHMVRPYIRVQSIPDFDPTPLPYWTLYSQKQTSDGTKNASYNPNVKIGGKLGGETVPGLSGGQRKMLLFELVKQRISSTSSLLLVFDEPFAGVTDDFLPYILESLVTMRENHIILLVTNDHVSALTDVADCTITVSAVDRSQVLVNGKKFDRQTTLHAVAVGRTYTHSTTKHDMRFFMETEGLSSPHVQGVLGFTVFALILFLLAFWNSRRGSEAFVLVAAGLICFLAFNPYLVSLPDWRNTVNEEAQVLLHASVRLSMALKVVISFLVFLIIHTAAFGFLAMCIDIDCESSLSSFTLCPGTLWLAFIFDNWSLTVGFICFGIYTRLPLQAVDTLGSMPFLLILFFSTAFSPGGGLPGVKALRYLFSRFYLWCGVPYVKQSMEGCPPDDTLIWFIALTSNLVGILFVSFQAIRSFHQKREKSRLMRGKQGIASTPEFAELRHLFVGNIGRHLSVGNIGIAPSS